MQKCGRVVFLVICLCFASCASAWNALGHMVVAAIAYERLQPEVRYKVDCLATSLKKEYPNINNFVQMAPWPDSIRSQKIEVYTHWHYIDMPFSTDGSPLKNISDQDNVVWAINEIKPIVANKDANPYERARFLSLLIHIVGDIHQPLHTVGRISAAHLDGDQGGNLFTIHYPGSQSIPLHKLWDDGCGLFNGDASSKTVALLANKITNLFPEKNFNNLTNELSPDVWVKEGLENASIVYNTTENTTPSSDYLNNGQILVEQRIALAGYRLANLLNTLFGHH